MPRLSGRNIYIYKGETLKIEVTVKDEDGELATTVSSAKFAYRKGSTKVFKDCTIIGAVVSVSFTEAETLVMDGTYEYEFRVKSDANEVDTLFIARLYVETGIIVSAM